MKTMIEASSPSLDLERGGVEKNETADGGREWTDDSASEKGILQTGILQTKTLEVTYAQAEVGSTSRETIPPYGIAI